MNAWVAMILTMAFNTAITAGVGWIVTNNLSRLKKRDQGTPCPDNCPLKFYIDNHGNGHKETVLVEKR
jgi:hypothetical protein